jgi:hypothetical protein
MTRFRGAEPVNFRKRLAQPLILAFALAASALCSPLLQAQEVVEPPSEEVVANLAAGHVIIAVVKDGIIVVTVENPIETQTHPPIPVELNTRRVGVLLGAIDWFSPTSKVELARLDKELPFLRGAVAAPDRKSTQVATEGEATDLEAVGQGVLQRLNRVAANLHAKVDFPPGEPVVQLVIAGYVAEYGPEVWQLSFNLVQEMRKLDYYDTHVTRPVYLQFWPPEKAQPHTLLEFRYPASDKSPALLDLIKSKDPRIEKICMSDPKMRDVADRFLQGDYKKIAAVDATQFLRAVISATTAPNARQTMATVSPETGFEWVLKPPAEPKSAAAQEAEKAGKELPPEAPSLLHAPPR